MAEDVNFLTNRYQWEKLPTATLMKMGNDFMNIKNMPDSAMLCYSLIANRYNENLDREELEQSIRANCYVGIIYRTYFNNEPEAYKQTLKAKDLAEKHHYDDFVVKTLMELGNLSWQQNGLLHDNQFAKKAIDYHKAAFWKSVKTHSYRILPVIMINLNHIACIKKDFSISKKERATYNSLNIPDTTEFKTLTDIINHGVELFTIGRHEQALDAFRNVSIEDFKTNPKNKANIRIMLCEYIYNIQLKIGQHANALKTLTEIQELIKTECPELIGGFYGDITDYYRILNNQALADKYELLWWRTTDSIAQLNQSNRVDKVGFLYELDKMNEEQKTLTLKQQRDKQLLWVVSCFLFLALALLTLLFINRNRIKRKNRVLYENNLALLAADEQRRKMDEEQNRVNSEKYGTIRLDEQSSEELWQNINHVMMYSQEIYDESFNVARLAELVDAKPNYVSQAINQQEEWSFSSLLAHFRILEACRRMNDTANYGSYTIEGIAQSVGYSSRSHFVKIFKKQIGITPSDYIKQAKSKNTNTI
jgi:YesN/AraC family two-component response regulator